LTFFLSPQPAITNAVQAAINTAAPCQFLEAGDPEFEDRPTSRQQPGHGLRDQRIST
jgi:hypothetical protein